MYICLLYTSLVAVAVVALEVAIIVFVYEGPCCTSNKDIVKHFALESFLLKVMKWEQEKRKVKVRSSSILLHNVDDVHVSAVYVVGLCQLVD